MNKRDTLTLMLTKYREAQETLVQSNGGDPGNVRAMPSSYNTSFRELERCLHILSGERPKQARNVLARYVDPTVTRKRLVGRRNSRGEVVFANKPAHAEVRSYAQLPDRGHAHEWDCVVASWPKWVQPRLVEAGLDRLEELFRLVPFLPVEMVDWSEAA